MVSLFRQSASGTYSKDLYLAIARAEVIVLDTITVDVVQCPKCGLFGEVRLDDRGKVEPCPGCGASMRTAVKGIELDRITWR